MLRAPAGKAGVCVPACARRAAEAVLRASIRANLGDKLLWLPPWSILRSRGGFVAMCAVITIEMWRTSSGKLRAVECWK